MSLLIEDLNTSRELDRETCRAIAGGLGPVSGPAAGIDLSNLSGQVGQNSMVGSATSNGVLNTTLNLQLQVMPQINVSTNNLVDLDAITDLTQVVNSVIS
jgi:hypothetical protein